LLLALIACDEVAQSVPADAGSSSDVGDPPGPDCGDSISPARPLRCLGLARCYGSIADARCIEPRCDAHAHPSALDLLLAYSDCVGEHCLELRDDRDAWRACTHEFCAAEGLGCQADGDRESCWELDACIVRECDEEAPATCRSDCFDAANDTCRLCLSAAHDQFITSHCSAEMQSRDRCVQANGCQDSECVVEHCNGPVETLGNCIDVAAETDRAGYSELLGPCYELLEPTADD